MIAKINDNNILMFPKLSNYVKDNRINIAKISLDEIKEHLILLNGEVQHYTPGISYHLIKLTLNPFIPLIHLKM